MSFLILIILGGAAFIIVFNKSIRKERSKYANADHIKEVKEYLDNKNQFSSSNLHVKIKNERLMNTRFKVVQKESKIGLTLRESGKSILQPIYDDLDCLRIGYPGSWIGVRLDNKWGVMMDDGELVIPIQFEHIIDYNRKYKWAKVQQGENQIYVNSLGNVISDKFVKLQEAAGAFFEVIEEDTKIGLKNSVSPIYDNIRFLQEYLSGVSFVAIELNDKWGVIECGTETILIPIEYDYIIKYANGRAIVKKDSKEIVVNSKGEQIFPEGEEYCALYGCNYIETVESYYDGDYGTRYCTRCGYSYEGYLGSR